MLDTDSSKKSRARWLREALTGEIVVTTLDVGADPSHQPPYADLMDMNAITLIGFEPLEEAAEQLERQRSEHEIYYQTALGARGKRPFYIYPQDTFSTAYHLDPASAGILGWHRQVRGEAETSLHFAQLDDLENLPEVHLLEIDAQASEPDILEGGSRTLANIDVAIVEVNLRPLYNRGATFAEVDAFMQSIGLMFHKFDFLKSLPLRNSQSSKLRARRMGEQVVDGDAVYVRDFRTPGTLSTEQLQRIALISDVVIDSPSLCLFCIDELARREVVTPSCAAEYAAQLPEALQR